MLARVAIVMVVLISAVAFAATPRQDAKGPDHASQKPPSQKDGPAKEKDEYIDIKFSGVVHNTSTEIGEATLVTITDDQTVIQADKAKWNNKSSVKQAESVGNVRMTDPQADATGEKAVIYYAAKKKLMVLTGKVQINVKPRDEDGSAPAAKATGPAPVTLQDGKATVGKDNSAASSDSDDSPRKYPTLVTCDKAEYQYAKDRKHAMLTGHFKAVQQLKDNTRTMTADHGEWFGLEDRLVLFPPVHYEDTKGTIFEPQGEVTIHTKKGDEWMKTGPGTIKLRSDTLDEEGEKKEKPADKKPAKKQ